MIMPSCKLHVYWKIGFCLLPTKHGFKNIISVDISTAAAFIKEDIVQEELSNMKLNENS